MADPKYENLPGIAYDQPDVYETGDLPEADQPEPYEEEENESIEQLHLSVKDSFNKFKGKFLTGNVDFSDRLSRKNRIGYRAGEWGLAAEGEPETALERYNRLRCEFSELLEQITEQQNKATESEQSKHLDLEVAVQKKILKELNPRFIASTGDGRACAFFAQRIRIAIQRGNSASILGTIPRGYDL